MSPVQNNFIEQLYRENFGRLVGYAFHQTKDWGRAEVAVQEAFCVAVKKIDAVMAHEAPLGWIRATITNTVRNMEKQERRQKELFLYFEELSFSPSAPDVLKGIELEDWCKKTLGEERFRLFRYVVLDGGSYLEASKEFGLGVWACRKRVERATDRLCEELKKYF